MKLFGSNHKAVRTKKAAKKAASQTGGAAISKGKKAVLIILSVLLILVLSVAVFLKVYVKPPEIIAPIRVTGTASEPGTETDPTKQPDDNMKPGYYNILLAGTDNDGTRTDTMMIARIDTVEHSLALMSIPRDTMIETSNGGVAKLNSVYGANGCGHDGMEALMLKLEDILGFMPSGYALVNLDAFMELVDVIGGVDFYVPQDMYHNDPTQDLYIDLQEGYQHLDGNKAMQLVRFRGYVQADIQRTKVQQDFLITVAKQCMAISNWDKISEYIDIFTRNVTTNFTGGNMLFFAQELMKCDLTDMPTYTLPGRDVWLDAAYLDLIDEEVAAIVEKDFNPYVG